METAIPKWFHYLESQGISQFWLSSLEASTVCDFSSRCPRVGLFLDFLENEKDGQPSVQWYTSLNVPVWYPWTNRHQKAVKQRPELAYLQPPPELLQAATTFTIRTPTAILPSALLPSALPPSSSSAQLLHSHEPPSRNPFFDDDQPYQGTHDSSGAHFQATQKAYIATQPWSKFFRARNELNKKKMEKETPAQRQTRINRERKPPIKKVDVYLWDWSDEDPLQLVRTRVTRREGEDILSNYRNSHLIYDSYSNVWDACEYFGQPDEDSDDESVVGCVVPTDSAFTHAPIPSITDDNGASEQAAHEAFCQDRLLQLSTAPPSERFKKLFLSYSLDTLSKLDLAQDTFDLLGYLVFHYGFVPPLPPKSDSPVNPKDWEENLKNVGLDASKNPLPNDMAASIIQFLQGLRLASGPSEELWDLRSGNHRKVRADTLSTIIPKKSDSFFFVSPPALQEEPSCPWIIALTTAADALFVYRLLLEKDFSAISLGYLLVDEGMRFRTLLCLPRLSIPSSIKTVHAVIPIRVKDYEFNASDYHSYVQERTRLLSSPRGRAALLEGGIVGRIAKEHLGHDCAALGPSSAVTVRRDGFSFEDATNGTYWDDALSKEEIHIVCGLYRCYTGMTPLCLINLVLILYSR
jgi:hypothetical protein